MPGGGDGSVFEAMDVFQVPQLDAEELINAAMYILRARMTIDDVIDAPTVFPTLSESIKYAALSFRTDIDKLSCCI